MSPTRTMPILFAGFLLFVGAVPAQDALIFADGTGSALNSQSYFDTSTNTSVFFSNQANFVLDSFEGFTTPEPGPLVLLGLGFIGFGIRRKKRVL